MAKAGQIIVDTADDQLAAPGVAQGYQLDEGILRARWLSRDELMAVREDWRSELIIRCIDDYLAGQRHSLELIRPSL